MTRHLRIRARRRAPGQGETAWGDRGLGRLDRGLLLAALAAAAAMGSRAEAQGTLSAQGLGYPPGQLSARARGTAGALGEFDALSPLNPASIGALGRSTLAFQYEPEFRSVDAGAGPARTTTLRFPVTTAAIPVGERYVVGIALSTLADRTWATQFTSRAVIPGFGPDSVTSTQTFKNIGAINDIRLAGAARLGTRGQVGIGLHAFSGSNTATVAREFAGLPRSAFGDTTRLDYAGTALSAGMQLRVVRGLAVAIDGRQGGVLRLRQTDTVRATGRVPNRVGVGVLIDLIPGATLAARYAWEGWAATQPIGRALGASDTQDMSIGADLVGPRLGRSAMQLRAGARSRDLPFAAGGSRVRERSVVGGLGVPLANERAAVDVAVERAARSGLGGVREAATILSLGLTVHP